MNSTCNVCGASFEIVPASLKIIKDARQAAPAEQLGSPEANCTGSNRRFEAAHQAIHFSYFECPECGTAYLYLVTDRELRRRIERGKGWNPEGIPSQPYGADRDGSNRRFEAPRLGRYTITDALRRELEQRYTPRFAELVEKAYKPKTP